MKKIAIIAALVFAALTMRAQAPADSVSVMLRHLGNTNREISRIEKSYYNHAAMVSFGGLVMAAGTLLNIQGESLAENGHPHGAKTARLGRWITAGGMAIVAASFFVLPKRMHLDGRGLVIDLK